MRGSAATANPLLLRVNVVREACLVEIRAYSTNKERSVFSAHAIGHTPYALFFGQSMLHEERAFWLCRPEPSCSKHAG
jgi:hypothetical protein